MSTTMFFILIMLPLLCSGLNCYSCSGTTGCNDPFNSLGSGVSTTGAISSNIYCIKTNYAGTIVRSGGTTCTAYWYSSNGYQTCCQSNFCNSAKKTNLHLKSFVLLITYLLTYIID